MFENIAKRYVKAIVENTSVSECEKYLEELLKINQALNVEKFLNIINSPYVKKYDKKDLTLELLDSRTEKIINLIKLLIDNDRICIIPEICSVLKSYIDEKNKCYEGILYVKESLDKDVLNHINTSLSKRLNVDLSIKEEISKIEGIKMSVSGLGVEISFSKESFLNDLKNHILKAI